MIEANTMSALASQAQTYADWLLMKRFCDQIYGEGKAVKVVIETEGEYNDEGGTNYRLTELTAYDKDGDELAYDLSLPFWKLDVVREVLKDYDEEDEDENEDENVDPNSIQEALREMYWPTYGKNAQPRPNNLVLWEDFSIDADSDVKYDLTQPPDSPLLAKYGIL